MGHGYARIASGCPEPCEWYYDGDEGEWLSQLTCGDSDDNDGNCECDTPIGSGSDGDVTTTPCTQNDGCGEQCKWVWSNTGAAGQWMNDPYWGGYNNCVEGAGNCNTCNSPEPLGYGNFGTVFVQKNY